MKASRSAARAGVTAMAQLEVGELASRPAGAGVGEEAGDAHAVGVGGAQLRAGGAGARGAGSAECRAATPTGRPGRVASATQAPVTGFDLHPLLGGAGLARLVGGGPCLGG